MLKETENILIVSDLNKSSIKTLIEIKMLQNKTNLKKKCSYNFENNNLEKK